MFDAHCHLDFEAFDDDREEALERARAAGLNGIIIAGYDRARRPLAARLARRAGIFATAGLHPWALSGRDDAWLDRELEALRNDLEAGGFVGLGELGLDHFRATDAAERELQRRAFVAQLGIARELDLPLVIHAVKCHATLYEILRKEGLPDAGGIMHGYSGSARQVGLFLMLGLDISIGTPVTFHNAARITDAVRQVPDDRLLVETDAPDRAPEPHRGERNELQHLQLVIESVARIRGQTPDAIARISEQNARRRFRLGDGRLAAPPTGNTPTRTP